METASMDVDDGEDISNEVNSAINNTVDQGLTLAAVDGPITLDMVGIISAPDPGPQQAPIGPNDSDTAASPFGGNVSTGTSAQAPTAPINTTVGTVSVSLQLTPNGK